MDCGSFGLPTGDTKALWGVVVVADFSEMVIFRLLLTSGKVIAPGFRLVGWASQVRLLWGKAW
jgi:hypothetical protein